MDREDANDVYLQKRKFCIVCDEFLNSVQAMNNYIPYNNFVPLRFCIKRVSSKQKKNYAHFR